MAHRPRRSIRGAKDALRSRQAGQAGQARGRRGWEGRTVAVIAANSCWPWMLLPAKHGKPGDRISQRASQEHIRRKM